MRRTYGVPFSRAGLAGLMAALVLLCLPGTSIAGGASDTSSALRGRLGPAPVRSRLRQGRRELRPCASFSARCGGWAGSPARWTGCTGRGPRPRSPASKPPRRSRPTGSSVRDAACADARNRTSRSGGEPASHSPTGRRGCVRSRSRCSGTGFGPARWTASSGRGPRRRSNASSGPAGCPSSGVATAQHAAALHRRPRAEQPEQRASTSARARQPAAAEQRRGRQRPADAGRPRRRPGSTRVEVISGASRATWPCRSSS